MLQPQAIIPPPLVRLVTTTTGPFDVAYIGHADAQAFDLNAGRIGACVETADLSIAYRDTNEVFHQKFTPMLEALSGESRRVDKKATDAKRKAAKQPDKVKPLYESFITFSNRAKAQVLRQPDGETLWADIEARALVFSKTLVIDSAPVARVTPLRKSDSVIAEEWLATADTDFVEEKIAKYSDYLGGYEVERGDDNKPLSDSLSRLITAFKKRKNENVLAED